MHDAEPSPADFVASLAPEVDRLVIAGHRAAGPRVRPIREELALPNFGVLIDLRKLLLSPRGMDLVAAAAIERYRNPGDIVADIGRHVSQGLLRWNLERVVPTNGGRMLLDRLTIALGEAVDILWPDVEPARDVTATLHAVIEEARASLSPDRFPAFYAEDGGFMPDRPSPAMLLWSMLSSLRYLRADAHALAWRARGLNREEILTLTAGCNRIDTTTVTQVWAGVLADARTLFQTLDRLRERGWVSQSGETWTVTSAGREVRREIERDTNRYNSTPYAILEPPQRERLLDRLGRLPGDGG